MKLLFISLIMFNAMSVSANECTEYLTQKPAYTKLMVMQNHLKSFEFMATIILSKQLRDGHFLSLYTQEHQLVVRNKGIIFRKQDISYDIRNKSLEIVKTQIDLIMKGQNTIYYDLMDLSAQDSLYFQSIWDNLAAQNIVMDFLTENIDQIILNAQLIPNLRPLKRAKGFISEFEKAYTDFILLYINLFLKRTKDGRAGHTQIYSRFNSSSKTYFLSKFFPDHSYSAIDIEYNSDSVLEHARKLESIFY